MTVCESPGLLPLSVVLLSVPPSLVKNRALIRDICVKTPTMQQ